MMVTVVLVVTIIVVGVVNTVLALKAIVVLFSLSAVVLVRTGVVVDTCVDMSTAADMRANKLILLSDVAVDLLIYALTEIVCGSLPSIEARGFVDVNEKGFAVAITAFEFAMPESFHTFPC